MANTQKNQKAISKPAPGDRDVEALMKATEGFSGRAILAVAVRSVMRVECLVPTGTRNAEVVAEAVRIAANACDPRQDEKANAKGHRPKFFGLPSLSRSADHVELAGEHLIESVVWFYEEAEGIRLSTALVLYNAIAAVAALAGHTVPGRFLSSAPGLELQLEHLHDLSCLASAKPIPWNPSEDGPLGLFWTRTAPAWYCRRMLEKDQKDQSTFLAAWQALADISIPPLPVKHVDDLTPETVPMVLDALLKHLEKVGDPVAAVVQLLLKELQGNSFGSLEESKEFTSKVQTILDRIGYGIECPSCFELGGRFDVTTHHNSPTGAFRIRHGRMSHGGSTSLPSVSVKKLD